MVRTKKKTKIDKSKCSPHNRENKFTCFTKSSLIKIIESWNKYYKKKISYKKTDTVKILWLKLDRSFKKSCDTEWCWLNQPVVKNIMDEELKTTFKPKMPTKWNSNKNEWLTTSDIQNVLRQYQKKHKDFFFVGAVPIDFDKQLSPGYCVINELCNINLKKLLARKKNKLGIVFNLDKHDEPGSHWVAMYCDFNNNNLYYFDSYGVEPPNEVMVLLKRLKQQGLELNKNINIYINKVRHQYKNSECGVYSINFITNLLGGKKYEDLINNRISDDLMENKRNFYFIKV